MFSVRENLLVVNGTPETKQLTDLVPEILKQVGPQQYNHLKNVMADFAKHSSAKKSDAEEDEDDVPPLVENFETTEWIANERLASWNTFDKLLFPKWEYISSRVRILPLSIPEIFEYNYVYSSTPI